MITITEKITEAIDFELTRYADLKDILFFDIETTGLSSERCSVYLIGCVYYSDEGWFLKQFFAETKEAEGEILFHFFTMLSKYKLLIHFNGDTFDIPFIKTRAEKLNIPHNNYMPESFDIYRMLKPFKKQLNLPNCKQKTIEKLLGIDREDIYNGGQLIEIYHDYLKTHDEEEKRLLLLHNADDLKGLPQILPALYFPMFFNCDWTINSVNASINNNSLNINAALGGINLPALISYKKEDSTVTAKDNTLSVSIELLCGELKHFYEDYKNYYYLPEEDMAIHSSVAEFVDKAHRKKATAKNCYTKKSGCFIPCFDLNKKPLFYREYPLKKAYCLLDDSMLNDSVFLTDYLKATISG